MRFQHVLAIGFDGEKLQQKHNYALCIYNIFVIKAVKLGTHF